MQVCSSTLTPTSVTVKHLPRRLLPLFLREWSGGGGGRFSGMVGCVYTDTAQCENDRKTRMCTISHRDDLVDLTSGWQKYIKCSTHTVQYKSYTGVKGSS